MNKITSEYTATVDNYNIHLKAPSFPSYVDTGPLTPGQQADLARGAARVYPYHHIRLSQSIGKIDAINVRASFQFGVTEIRGDKPFSDFEEFKEWWNRRPFNKPLISEPCDAFGITGIRSTLTNENDKFNLIPVEKEEYFFLGKSGVILYIHFNLTRYVDSVPVAEKCKMDRLISELKQGLVIKAL
jgi:hypothetical protein